MKRLFYMSALFLLVVFYFLLLQALSGAFASSRGGFAFRFSFSFFSACIKTQQFAKNRPFHGDKCWAVIELFCFDSAPFSSGPDGIKTDAQQQ